MGLKIWAPPRFRFTTPRTSATSSISGPGYSELHCVQFIPILSGAMRAGFQPLLLSLAQRHALSSPEYPEASYFVGGFLSRGRVGDIQPWLVLAVVGVITNHFQEG